MKKTIVVLLAAMAVTLLAPQAQAITFGLKGGLNFANVKAGGTDMPDFKNVNGLTGGIFFSLGLGPISIQPEVLYSRRGVAMTFTEGETTFDGKIMLDYVEVPVLLKLRVIQAGPVKPFVFGGPAYSYLIKARQKLTVGGDSETMDSTDSFKRSEIAAVFGAGIDLNLVAVKLTVDARYHLGLTNIAINEEGGTSEAKNKGFSVMVGFAF